MQVAGGRTREPNICGVSSPSAGGKFVVSSATASGPGVDVGTESSAWGFTKI